MFPFEKSEARRHCELTLLFYYQAATRPTMVLTKPVNISNDKIQWHKSMNLIRTFYENSKKYENTERELWLKPRHVFIYFWYLAITTVVKKQFQQIIIKKSITI